MDKSITLIGMAGAGKSTIGIKLAKLLEFNFLDGDTMIEEKINLFRAFSITMAEKSLQKLKKKYYCQLI